MSHREEVDNLKKKETQSHYFQINMRTTANINRKGFRQAVPTV